MNQTMRLSPKELQSLMKDCTLCPRQCHVNRLEGETGFCGQSADITAARAALHYWEEPCLSGKSGSGTVFFSGCSLRCVYCQNHDIALGRRGRILSSDRLPRIFLELQEKGAANINLVTAGHFLPQVCLALETAKKSGLFIPVVYNTSSYEEVSSLRLLDGLVDIYLPDLKYHSPLLSQRFSHAPDYFEKACLAIREMFRQVKTPVFGSGDGMMKRGLIVRHLLLPGQTGDSKRILRYLHNTYGNDIYVSIMNQYTPLPHLEQLPEPERSQLQHTVTPEEYIRVLDFACRIGIEQGFRQEGQTAAESFIPPFDGEGL